jgi:hypothetical protein
MARKGQPTSGKSSESNERSTAEIVAQASKLGRPARILGNDEVLVLLRAAVEREGNQVAFARRHGVERSGLNMILNGRRPVNEKIIKALGLRKVYVAPE